ncbi:unnamed protein product, partial [Closterium sp. NIES-65]
ECLSFVVNSPSLPHLPHAPLSSHSFASFNTLPLFHPLTPLLCRPSLPPSFPMPPPLQLYTLLYLAWRPQFGPAWHSLDRNSLPHFLTFLVSPFHSPLPSLPPSQLYTFLYLAWRPQFGPAWHSLDRNSLPHFLTFLLLLSLLSTLTTLCDLLLLCTTGHRFVLVTLAAVTALIPAALYVLVAATCEAVRTVGQVDDWGSGEHVALCSPLVLLDLCLAAWLIPAALTTKAQVRRVNVGGTWTRVSRDCACGEHVALCAPLLLLDLCLAAWLIPTARATEAQVRRVNVGGTWTRVSRDCACGEHVALCAPLLLLDLCLAAWLIPTARATEAQVRRVNVGGTWTRVSRDCACGEHVALCAPLLLLDLCLAAWLIPTARATEAQASDSRLLSTFRQALSAMGGISAAALALTCWEAYVKLSDPLNLQWQSDWLITAAWHLLSFLALASLCFLWSPALLSLRLASPEST